MSGPKQSTTVVPLAAARRLHAFGSELIVHVGGAETGGKYVMMTSVTPPGGGAPPHCHTREDEWFLVLDGRAEFLRDGEWIDAPVGAAVFTPRGVIHAFRNAGPSPLRMLIHTSPAGFENFFARCAEEFARSPSPEMSRLAQIAGEHGIQFAS